VLPAADAEAVMEVLPEAALPEAVMEALPEEVIEALPEEVMEALEELPAEGVALPDGHEGCVLTSTFWRLQSWTAKLVVVWISACEHVANTQQDTSLITLLPQMHAMSATPQLPRLPPKHC